MVADVHCATVVIGLGKTGFSCVEYFARQGIAVAVVDQDSAPTLLSRLHAEYPHVPFIVFDQATDLLHQATCWVVSPGVSLQQLKNQFDNWHEKQLLSDIALFCQQAQAPIVAITGSNGKTTVTTMMGEVIAAAGYTVEVCGNIGEPVLDVLQQPAPDYYVLELSSFQLEMLPCLDARAAVVLNVEPDHMDRYACFADYVQTKQRIYCGVDQAVINCDQQQAWQQVTFTRPAIGFTMQGAIASGYGLCMRGEEAFLMQGDRELMAAAQMKLSGHHHWQNALAVLALTESLRLPMDAALTVLRNFDGLMHRCQLVAEHNKVRWVNDSKATNVAATIAAIKTLRASSAGDLVLIMGGDGKGADFSLLREAMGSFVRAVILIGRDAGQIERVIQGGVAVSHAPTLRDAVISASRYAKPGDIVALSPACASFDMFDNYEHRGKEFIHWVEQLT